MENHHHSLSRIRIIYILTTLLLVVLAIYLFFQIKNLIDSSTLVNHTHKVNQSLQKISSAVFEAQNNKRGFLLSKDSAMLDKKKLILNKLMREVMLLNRLVKDNPEQVQNLKALEVAIYESIASINNIPTESPSSVIANVAVGIQTMDSVKWNRTYAVKSYVRFSFISLVSICSLN